MNESVVSATKRYVNVSYVDK